MLLPSGDDVFCNLKFKAGSPEKFLEDVLSVLPLTADNCFESVLVFFKIAAKLIQAASSVIRLMFLYAVVDRSMQINKTILWLKVLLSSIIYQTFFSWFLV